MLGAAGAQVVMDPKIGFKEHGRLEHGHWTVVDVANVVLLDNLHT